MSGSGSRPRSRARSPRAAVDRSPSAAPAVDLPVAQLDRRWQVRGAGLLQDGEHGAALADGGPALVGPVQGGMQQQPHGGQSAAATASRTAAGNP